MGILDDLDSLEPEFGNEKTLPRSEPMRPERRGFVEADVSAAPEKSWWDRAGDFFKPFVQNIENMDLARSQDVRPDVLDYDGSYAHQPLGTASYDENGIVYFDGADGKSIQANKKDHVVLRDPRSDQLMVFRRDPEWNEGNIAQAIRAMSQGMLTGPVTGIQRGAQAADTTRKAITASRASDAARDLDAFDNLGIRPFGPAFSSGPVASIAKQLSETPFIGGPVRNALDESIAGTARAVEDVAGRMSPARAHNEVGDTVQRGLERFGTSGLDDLEPGIVQGLGIEPRATVPRAQVMSQGAANAAREAAPLRARYGSDTAETTRGVQRPSAAPLGQVLTTRTPIEAVPDEQLIAVIRAPASDTSFATRAEALYERAWRFVPTMMRSNDTANPNMIPAVNTRRALTQIDQSVANDIAGQGTIGGPLAERLRNPRASNFPLSDLRAIRTEIGRALSNTNPLKQTLDRSQLKSLYAGISQDIEVGLETLANRAAILARDGGDAPNLVEEARRAANALRAFRTADHYFRQGVGSMERFHKVLGADTPEMAAKRLIAAATGEGRGDLGMVQSAHAALRPEEWNDVSALVLRSLGTPNPSARDAAKEFGFSVQTFLTNWQKMDPRARQMLFGGEHAAAIDDIARVAERLADVESKLNTSRSATNALNVGVPATVATAIYSGLDSMLTAGAGLGATASMSYMMSRPSYARWMANYLQMRGNGTAPQVHGHIAAHINRLRSMAQADPQLVPIARAIAEENGVEEAGDDDRSQNQNMRRDHPRRNQDQETNRSQQGDPLSFEDADIVEGEPMTPSIPRRASGGVAEPVLPESMTGDQPPPFEPWVMWSQENYDPKMSQPRDMENFRPFQKPPLKIPPIPQQDKDRLRELLRQDGDRLRQNRPDLFEDEERKDEVLPPGSNLNLGSPNQFAAMTLGGNTYEEGGVVSKPYDYSPEDEFSSVDMARYLAGRAVRRDGTMGLGNQIAARYQAYKDDRPVDDVLREYRGADDAFAEDYPFTAGATDVGSAIAGGVLGGGALRASGSIGQRLAAAPYMWNNTGQMAAVSGAASLGDTYLNEPDATPEDYAWDVGLSAASAVPGMMAVGKGLDVASDLIEGDVYKKLFRKGPKESTEDWHKHDLSKGEAKVSTPADRAPVKPDRAPDGSGRTMDAYPFSAQPPRVPKVYQRSSEHYYPDMPDMPANPIHKPTGKGYEGPSTRTERDADFFGSAYEEMGEVPEHITRIRQNRAKQYINERGRYIPLSDAQVYERLKKKGLLGQMQIRRAPGLKPSLPKPKPTQD